QDVMEKKRTTLSHDEAASLEEHLTPWLVACDQALAAGTPPPRVVGAETPQELRPRLERNLECLKLVRQVLRRQAPSRPLPASNELPLTNLGRFQIERELGRGAFGVVFLASDPVLGRQVAVKVPRPEILLTSELRDRFVREARAAAGLDHPHLVPVYEAGEI